MEKKEKNRDREQNKTEHTCTNTQIPRKITT